MTARTGGRPALRLVAGPESLLPGPQLNGKFIGPVDGADFVWLIGGHPARLTVWTEDQWRALPTADRPARYQGPHDGFVTALAMA
jgi:hypothetical protein